MAKNFQWKRSTFPYYRKLSHMGSIVLLIFSMVIVFAFKGDSLYGKVTAVKNAAEMTFEANSVNYNIRLVGVDVPISVADSAVQFVSKLILGKNARMRFEGRTPNNVMMVRLFTDDPIIGIKEVGLELLKVGLARRQRNYDYKYGELAAAEREAQEAKRGLWGRINN